MPASAHDRARRLAGALSLLAAFVHGGLTPEHFTEWWGYGAFFAVAATAQALLGLALLLDAVPDPRARRAVWRLGLVGQLLLVAMYVLTRTVGIPLVGPSAGSIEEVAPIDVLAVGMELACAGLLAWVSFARAPAGRHALPDAAR